MILETGNAGWLRNHMRKLASYYECGIHNRKIIYCLKSDQITWYFPFKYMLMKYNRVLRALHYFHLDALSHDNIDILHISLKIK